MSKKAINTDKAPAAIGPYSQAVQIANLLYTSGQIPIEPKSGQVVAGGIEGQAKQVFANLQAILEAVGAGFADVVKTTVFIKDMNDFVKLNQIYAQYFSEPFPARSCIEVARLPKDVLVEVEVIAAIK